MLQAIQDRLKWPEHITETAIAIYVYKVLQYFVGSSRMFLAFYANEKTFL